MTEKKQILGFQDSFHNEINQESVKFCKTKNCIVQHKNNAQN